jgi:hypothetical protein
MSLSIFSDRIRDFFDSCLCCFRKASVGFDVATENRRVSQTAVVQDFASVAPGLTNT